MVRRKVKTGSGDTYTIALTSFACERAARRDSSSRLDLTLAKKEKTFQPCCAVWTGGHSSCPPIIYFGVDEQEIGVT
jgi:hypothetical protein